MLKLIDINYNVMLNGYSQWLTIRGTFFIGKSVLIGISDTGLQPYKYDVKQI